jgi:hypothetical protein
LVGPRSITGGAGKNDIDHPISDAIHSGPVTCRARASDSARPNFGTSESDRVCAARRRAGAPRGPRSNVLDSRPPDPGPAGPGRARSRYSWMIMIASLQFRARRSESGPAAGSEAQGQPDYSEAARARALSLSPAAASAAGRASLAVTVTPRRRCHGEALPVGPAAAACAGVATPTRRPGSEPGHTVTRRSESDSAASHPTRRA